MHSELLDTEEAEVLALVDDWLSTTPEIFGDDDPYTEFEHETPDFWEDDDDTA